MNTYQQSQRKWKPYKQQHEKKEENFFHRSKEELGRENIIKEIMAKNS